MILAMFAIKDILIEPVIFEKWFAQHLVDYDPSSNSGGVLWSASTGVDAQPYFRVFSPWLQTERYDPETIFIKRWIPELKEVPIKDILKWEKKYVDYQGIQYPKPIVNHTERAKIVMSLFKEHS
jgi:deoxyribodipyrimidine photo-lyase